MIKADLVNRVVSENGDVPRLKAAIAVDTIIDALKDALRQGKRIELRGFGVFQVRERKKGVGRNPKTGIEVAITPGKTVRFKPGKELKNL
jgi:DNA-binding protein HU-beta